MFCKDHVKTNIPVTAGRLKRGIIFAQGKPGKNPAGTGILPIQICCLALFYHGIPADSRADNGAAPVEKYPCTPDETQDTGKKKKPPEHASHGQAQAKIRYP